MTKQEVLRFFEEISPEAYHIEDAAYILHIKDSHELAEFMILVENLTKEGVLMKKGDDFYCYVKNTPVKEEVGIYKGYRKAFGFLIGPDLKEDVYIAEENKNGAMHNDKVRVRILSEGGGYKKREGIVTEILERANETIVGTFDRDKKYGFVIPDDERIGADVYVELKNSMEARSGAKVQVKITKWPEPNHRAEGTIIRILGYEGDVGVDINVIMAKHKIPFVFPENVLAEAAQEDLTVVPEKGRLDLRGEELITIDGEDAKDLDDAVSLTVTEEGLYRLGVHIADVSHYVKSHSAIDKEAYSRGTSVYLVDRVIPMLPQVLSNGICSLNAKEDRYAMSCIMDIDALGKVVKFHITPSLINVKRRCNYTEVYKALEENIIPDDLQPLMPLLVNLKTLQHILNQMRSRRGALDFDFPEYKVMIDKEGKPLRIVRKDRTVAERMIEECMLIANETVASFLRDTENPSVYRIHEIPRAEKLINLKTVMAYLGKELHIEGDVRPQDFQHFLKDVAGTDVERVAQVMALRSMQQAKYSSTNVGHFGLASECYTHFTSPIRRYPDLMIHRLLKKTIGWTRDFAKRDGDGAYLARAAEHSSVMEQVAVEAERETDDLKKTEYMLPFVGQAFNGTVNSITSFGMFIELENGIDGLVSLSTMEDDYYFFDEEHFLLVGRRTGTTYHLGQEVVVTLAKVDVERRQIDFVLGEITDINELSRKIMKNARKKEPTAKSKVSAKPKNRPKDMGNKNRSKDTGNKNRRKVKKKKRK